jgi:hypothetical protein
MSLVSSQSHQKQKTVLSQAAWYLVRQFAGIYGVKMDYSKVKRLSHEKISQAYFIKAKLPPFARTVTYNASGKPERLYSIKPRAWVDLILMYAARGYKNRKFYEALAVSLKPPEKVLCICGLKMGSLVHQKACHYITKSHINRMLSRVKLNEIEEYEQRQPAEKGHVPYKVTISIRTPRPGAPGVFYYPLILTDLRPYIREREYLYYVYNIVDSYDYSSIENGDLGPSRQRDDFLLEFFNTNAPAAIRNTADI